MIVKKSIENKDQTNIRYELFWEVLYVLFNNIYNDSSNQF